MAHNNFKHGQSVRLVRTLTNDPEVPVGAQGDIHSVKHTDGIWVMFTIVEADRYYLARVAPEDIASMEESQDVKQVPLW
jgi:hypothetical protein